ncbi:MAG: hypothetical protein JWQ23_4555 [Herminiimonas sp.]|nr:hypothetical protein [Herminiimonas sp.]
MHPQKQLALTDYTGVVEFYMFLNSQPVDNFLHVTSDPMPVLTSRPKEPDQKVRRRAQAAVNLVLENGKGLSGRTDSEPSNKKVYVQMLAAAVKFDNPKAPDIKEIIKATIPLYVQESKRRENRNNYSRTWEGLEQQLKACVRTNGFNAIRKVLSRLPPDFGAMKETKQIEEELRKAGATLTEVEAMLVPKAVNIFCFDNGRSLNFGMREAMDPLLKAIKSISSGEEKDLEGLLQMIAGRHKLSTESSSRKLKRENSTPSKATPRKNRLERQASLPHFQSILDSKTVPRNPSNFSVNTGPKLTSWISSSNLNSTPKADQDVEGKIREKDVLAQTDVVPADPNRKVALLKFPETRARKAEDLDKAPPGSSRIATDVKPSILANSRTAKRPARQSDIELSEEGLANAKTPSLFSPIKFWLALPDEVKNLLPPNGVRVVRKLFEKLPGLSEESEDRIETIINEAIESAQLNVLERSLARTTLLIVAANSHHPGINQEGEVAYFLNRIAGRFN